MTARDFDTVHEEHRVMLASGVPENDPARATLVAELRFLLLGEQGAEDGEPLTDEGDEAFRLCVVRQVERRGAES